MEAFFSFSVDVFLSFFLFFISRYLLSSYPKDAKQQMMGVRSRESGLTATLPKHHRPQRHVRISFLPLSMERRRAKHLASRE